MCWIQIKVTKIISLSFVLILSFALRYLPIYYWGLSLGLFKNNWVPCLYYFGRHKSWQLMLILKSDTGWFLCISHNITMPSKIVVLFYILLQDPRKDVKKWSQFWWPINTIFWLKQYCSLCWNSFQDWRLHHKI